MYLQESNGNHMSKILLVITTYNQSKYTKLCFDSLEKLDDNFDVLVVDDYSTDDTLEICREYNHEVITKDEPLGLTDSWNKGYYEFKNRWFVNESGMDDNYDFLILANNDILIPLIITLSIKSILLEPENIPTSVTILVAIEIKGIKNRCSIL